jgi:predicted protein tyrosine phosphatase
MTRALFLYTHNRLRSPTAVMQPELVKLLDTKAWGFLKRA